MNNEQKDLLTLWGLGQEARKNIVTFLISILTLAVIALFGVIVKKDLDAHTMRIELIKCKESNAQKIEDLKNEQLRILDAINQTLNEENKQYREIKKK